MSEKPFFGRSIGDLIIAAGPSILLGIGVGAIAYKFVDPAPPRHLVITTGDDEGDYQGHAKLYQEILKDDGIDLEILPSSGAMENLNRLKDPKFRVDAGFVQDGLGSSDEAPDLASLGSLYYEPIWVFYRGKPEISRFSQLIGKRIAVGKLGGGTRALALQLLKQGGATDSNTRFLDIGSQEAVDALKSGKVDAVFLVRTPDDPLVTDLVANSGVRLMSADQAEAIARRNPFLHHLVIPHGAFDLARGLPAKDVDLVSPTATLLVRDSLHPALTYLLLKAASQVHGEPGLFEKKNEFPIDKDYQFPLNTEAQHFYKSGIPFWQRYLPFWLATLVDRFILFVIPAIALVLPAIRLIPRFLQWRVKSRIYRRYGELKFLETQIKPGSAQERYEHYLRDLDSIEERVNHMKVPLDFSDHIYVLREHIEFVRQRIRRVLADPQA